MIGTNPWKQRASLVWAMLGPSVVLLIQVESTLAVLYGAGVISLPAGLRGGSSLVAGAILITVTVAQISSTLYRGARNARAKKFDQLRKLTERNISTEAASRWIMEGRRRLPGNIIWQLFILPFWPSAFILAPRSFSDIRRIIDRFELEPMRALRQLDDNLDVIAARRLTADIRLSEARWAGRCCAIVIAVIVFFGVTAFAARAGANYWILQTAMLILLTSRTVAFRASAEVLKREYDQFLPRVEALLELHRFDLYQALSLPIPRDSCDERKRGIGAWRRGERVEFARDEPSDVGTREQVAGLTELLRGPELVPYEGFASWNAGTESVELAFSRAPILSGGHAQLQVAGTGDAEYAPFEIAADSSNVTLLKVRDTIQAPVDGRTVSTTFEYQSPATTVGTPEVWFEVSQRGRFIQLLRVQAVAGRPDEQL